MIDYYWIYCSMSGCWMMDYLTQMMLQSFRWNLNSNYCCHHSNGNRWTSRLKCLRGNDRRFAGWEAEHSRRRYRH